MGYMTQSKAAKRAAPTPKPDEGDRASAHRAGRRTPIQAKLVVGAAHDPMEDEADRIADEVVASLRNGNTDAGAALAAGSTAVGRVARSTSSTTTGPVGLDGGAVSGEAESRIAAMRGGGAPLDEPLRRSMERSFGTDFGAVRVHEGDAAKSLNQELGAQAFTTGNDIFFRDGLPSATSADGQRLIAHELVHTMQQSGGASRSVQRKASGGAARLVSAKLSTTQRNEATIQGHNMQFDLVLDVPGKAKETVKGVDQSIARSLYGVTFQWWEEIIEEYNFHETDATKVAAGKAAGLGKTYKSWSDIYLANPQSQTFFSWKDSLSQADNNSIGAGTHTTGVLDRPALNLSAADYKSRTLRFRIDASDALGNSYKFDAIQVLKADDGVLTSSYYHDSTGTDLKSGAGDTAVMKFSSRVHPDVLRNDVPAFAAKAPGRKAGVRVFRDLELDQVMAETATVGTGMLTDIHKSMQQSNRLNGAPLIPSSDRYYEYDASDGGLLVAQVSGKTVKRMFYTKNVPYAVKVNVNGVDKNMQVRGFEQIPEEAFAAKKKKK